MKKILVINGHPRQKSFCGALIRRYIDEAESEKAETRVLNVRDMHLEDWFGFDRGSNHAEVPDSEDIRQAKELITWCDHVVFVFPTFWSAPPTQLKLFLEVIVVTGFAFQYHTPRQVLLLKTPVWDKLLKGRTASMISTMDTYPFVIRHLLRDPIGKMMDVVLAFTGIKLKHKHYFGSVLLFPEKKREKWLEKAFRIGRREARI